MTANGAPAKRAGSHTPGPWSARKIWRIEHDNDDGSGGVVCVLSQARLGHEADRVATANLIAAAPDMLAALQCVDAWLTECGVVNDDSPADVAAQAAIRTAITKATGGAS